MISTQTFTNIITSFADMGACESRSAQAISNSVTLMSQHEINSRARKIVSVLRKRITKDAPLHVLNFIKEFNLNEMFVQNSSNVQTLLAEVVSQFRRKDMCIVTWRDTSYPFDMLPQFKPAVFEILIYWRDPSVSRL